MRPDHAYTCPSDAVAIGVNSVMFHSRPSGDCYRAACPLAIRRGVSWPVASASMTTSSSSPPIIGREVQNRSCPLSAKVGLPWRAMASFVVLARLALAAVFFTAGSGWDGTIRAFGRDCAFSRFEDPLEFRTTRDDAGGIYWQNFTITLQPVVGGTARTEDVNPDDFPDR